jgi:hypothetical protein
MATTFLWILPTTPPTSSNEDGARLPRPPRAADARRTSYAIT